MKLSKVKKALIGTSIAGMITVSLSYGTYSWFTSETTAQGKIINSTVQLNNGQNIEENIVNIDGFSPSQLVFGDWMKINNTGTVASPLQAKLFQSIDKNLSIDTYKVGYVAIKYKVEPTADELKAYQIKLEELFKGTTNEVAQPKNIPLTIKDDKVDMIIGFVNQNSERKASNKSEILLGDGAESGEANVFWKLEPEEYISLSFGVKMDETASNDFQGVSYDAKLSVIAKQQDEGATYE